MVTFFLKKLVGSKWDNLVFADGLLENVCGWSVKYHSTIRVCVLQLVKQGIQYYYY